MYIFVFGIIATIVAYYLGVSVLNFVYGKDITLYRIPLCIIVLSSTIYTIGIVYSNVLTTMRKLIIQVLMYIAVTVVAIISSNILTQVMNIEGAVYAYGIIMLSFFIIYTIGYNLLVRKEAK